MSRLRPSIMASIEKALSRSYFGRGSFSVTYPDKGEILCAISFLPLPANLCALGEGKRGDDPMHLYAHTSPGAYKVKDDFWLHAVENFPYRVEEWSKRIREDLAKPPTAEAEIEQFRHKLEEELEKQGASAEGHFSEQEAAEMAARLDEMASKLSELQERQQITEEELSRLKKVLDGAKDDLQTYPKAVWYRVTATRIWEATKKVVGSAEGRAVLAAEARRLLGLDP
jgi:hypothetical protein